MNSKPEHEIVFKTGKEYTYELPNGTKYDVPKENGPLVEKEMKETLEKYKTKEPEGSDVNVKITELDFSQYDGKTC